MKQRSRRKNPKNYDGTKNTLHPLQNILPSVLQNLHSQHQERPDLILATWSELIGPKLKGMTEAVSFAEGVLTVSVKNSTLHSLLHQYERRGLLERLRHKFPKVTIKNIRFKIG